MQPNTVAAGTSKQQAGPKEKKATALKHPIDAIYDDSSEEGSLVIRLRSPRLFQRTLYFLDAFRDARR